MKYSLSYTLEIGDEKLLESIYRAISPDLVNLPSECRGEISAEGSSLHVRFECSNLGKLRALNNSFIDILLLLLGLIGELRYG